MRIKPSGRRSASSAEPYFCRHWSALFPRLKSRSSFRPELKPKGFVRQAANLWQYKSLLHQCLAEQLGALTDEVHLIDGMPIRLCCFTRAYRYRSFKGGADYGYCMAKDEVYYGFHGHLLISAAGVIAGFSATPANGNEREALWEIVPVIDGLLIGDKGYLRVRRGSLEPSMAQSGVETTANSAANRFTLQYGRCACARCGQIVLTNATLNRNRDWTID